MLNMQLEEFDESVTFVILAKVLAHVAATAGEAKNIAGAIKNALASMTPARAPADPLFTGIRMP